MQSGPSKVLVLRHSKSKGTGIEKSKDVTTLEWNVSLADITFKFLMYPHPHSLVPRLRSMIACANFTFSTVHEHASIHELLNLGLWVEFPHLPNSCSFCHSTV